jgi:pimeloyl-ACP methyl ester carboxylesterase
MSPEAPRCHERCGIRGGKRVTKAERVTFTLVHGAWHGGWCWDLLVDELTRRGHRCVAPDLPFDDPTATFDSYTQVITDALSGVDDPVLVGHSGGALTIPLVALRRPVKLLVYLCPSTPIATPRPNSPTSLQQGAWDAIKTDELGRSWWQPEDAIKGMYRHLDPVLAKWAAERLRPDADPGPYALEAPPKLPSSYIYTSEDEFFTPESRRWAARNVFGIEPIEMAGGHFPMLERPSELADVLVANLD